MQMIQRVQTILRPLIEYRLALSLGMSAVSGIILEGLSPIQNADPLLRYIALDRPRIFTGLLWSYDLFLYSTPFLAFSILFTLVYVHLYLPKLKTLAGSLPPYPDPLLRKDAFLTMFSRLSFKAGRRELLSGLLCLCRGII